MTTKVFFGFFLFFAPSIEKKLLKSVTQKEIKLAAESI